MSVKTERVNVPRACLRIRETARSASSMLTPASWYVIAFLDAISLRGRSIRFRAKSHDTRLTTADPHFGLDDLSALQTRIATRRGYLRLRLRVRPAARSPDAASQHQPGQPGASDP